jgi:hypothetical protein
MFDIYYRARNEADYIASKLLQMLAKDGGVATAKYLINRNQQSDGYAHLYERGRLDLTVKALIVEHQEWHRLFTDTELDRAEKRLSACGYEN